MQARHRVHAQLAASRAELRGASPFAKRYAEDIFPHGDNVSLPSALETGHEELQSLGQKVQVSRFAWCFAKSGSRLKGRRSGRAIAGRSKQVSCPLPSKQDGQDESLSVGKRQGMVTNSEHVSLGNLFPGDALSVVFHAVGRTHVDHEICPILKFHHRMLAGHVGISNHQVSRLFTSAYDETVLQYRNLFTLKNYAQRRRPRHGGGG